MSLQPPTQELVAKKLHANEWRFRHIFRGNGNLYELHYSLSYLIFVPLIFCVTKLIPGQQRRHLLQSGWSVFVSSKRLVAGDAFISLSFVGFWFMVFLICIYMFS